MENKKKIVYKNVSELVPYENNPRNNDDAVDYVANSIKNFHFQVPIVIDKNNVVIAGHTRLKACHKLGIKEVPCIVADDLTPEQVKAFRIADNKTSELAGWDMDKLDIELGEIADIDMGDFGFDIEDQGFDDEKTPEDKDVGIDDEKALVVDCENENEMEKTFYALTKEGYKCRIITL